MKRETREGILRTEFVTHRTRFGMRLVEPDELIKRICNAMDEQDQRDADLAPSPAVETDMVHTMAAQITDKMPTSMDILNHAMGWIERVGTAGPFASIGRAWISATKEFLEGNPDPIITLLRQDLQSMEEAARHGGSRHDQDEATEKAFGIIALLQRIAKEYGDEQVWGEQTQAAEVAGVDLADEASTNAPTGD